MHLPEPESVKKYKLFFFAFRLQLCDLAGAINTQEAHEAIKKTLNFDSEDDLDKIERYLWAVSVGSHPKIEIIKG